MQISGANDSKVGGATGRLLASLVARRSCDYFRRDSAHLEWSLIAGIADGSSSLGQFLMEAAGDGDHPFFR